MAMAVRRADGEISCEVKEVSSFVDKYPFLKWPFIRGTVSLVDSLIWGFKALTYSANESAETEEEILSEGEIIFSVVAALILGIGLFFLLPVGLAHLTKDFIVGSAMQNIAEGIIRVAIFMIYILAITQMKEIARTFQYHGAEHKSIHCYEAGEELTVKNAQKYSTLHPRCGTSFLFIVMVISIFVFSLVGVENFWWRMLSRIVLLPVVAGLAYEFLKFTAKHMDSPVGRILSWPGMMIQKMTTKEPEDDMVEVAIASLKAVMRAEGELPPEETAANHNETGAANEEDDPAIRCIKGNVEDDGWQPPARPVKEEKKEEAKAEAAVEEDDPSIRCIKGNVEDDGWQPPARPTKK